ncbi:hypothetical protein MMC18_004653 [Xylographa bjoerkii]|nr:hypothetical protein [Xylographa bjoerkii]
MSNNTPCPEEYILANMINIENVWGKASGQYQEADAMASEYLRSFMGSGVGVPLSLQEARLPELSISELSQRMDGLAFRPKVAKQ